MVNLLFRNVSTGALIQVSAELPFAAGTSLPPGQWDVAVASDWAEDRLVVSSGRPTHVFLIAGQSNATSRADFDGGADWPTNAYQMERWRPLEAVDVQLETNLVQPSDAAIIPAARPLHHHFRTPPGGMGWALQFSIDYLAANPGIDLVLIPAAHGSTGLTDGRWRPGGDLYADAVLRANTLMAANPSFVFQAILWHQGERDANAVVPAATYQFQLDEMIAAMRSDIVTASATQPFVLGEMLPSWVTGTPEREAIQSIITQTPARVPGTGVAISTGTSGADSVHFDSASMRVMGTRYVTALSEAVANIQTGTQWGIEGSTLTSFIPTPVPAVSGTIVVEGV